MKCLFFASNRRAGGVTYKNHLDDEIILIGTLKSVVLWRKKYRRSIVNCAAE